MHHGHELTEGACNSTKRGQFAGTIGRNKGANAQYSEFIAGEDPGTGKTERARSTTRDTKHRLQFQPAKSLE